MGIKYVVPGNFRTVPSAWKVVVAMVVEVTDKKAMACTIASSYSGREKAEVNSFSLLDPTCC